MRELTELKKLCRIIHRISDPAATLDCWKCQIIGGRQSIHAGKANMGKMMAAAEMGAFISSSVIERVKFAVMMADAQADVRSR
jgi:hypothetical protein